MKNGFSVQDFYVLKKSITSDGFESAKIWFRGEYITQEHEEDKKCIHNMSCSPSEIE